LNYVCDIVVKGSRSLSLICWWALVLLCYARPAYETLSALLP